MRPGTAGLWTLQADACLANLPGKAMPTLADWRDMQLRTKKVMGDERWLCNPFTLCCPIEGCRQLRHKLNAFNRVEYMWDTSGHWQSATHSGDLAAERLIARFK